MTSCTCKSCLVLPVKEEFAQFATIIAFGLFCFYFFYGIKNWIESVLSWTRITVSDTLKKNCSCFVMCRRSCLPVVLSCSRKAAVIPFRDVNFLRYFGCSNICFLEFLISLANFRLTWRIVAPTRRKIARKLGDISKRIERDIRSHYFCKLPHTNTSTTSFFGWTRSTSCAFLRLAVTLVTSCG